MVLGLCDNSTWANDGIIYTDGKYSTSSLNNWENDESLSLDMTKLIFPLFPWSNHTQTVGYRCLASRGKVRIKDTDLDDRMN